MQTVHMKGRILQYLIEKQPIWDFEIADKIQTDYEVEGAYWKGTVRALLADLSSCGLIESVEEQLDNGTHFGIDRALFCYKVTEFGKERMRDTGLMIERG